MSVWRAGNYRKVVLITEETCEDIAQRESKHKATLDKIKTHNALKTEIRLRTTFLRNTVKAWANVCKFLKLIREKDTLFRVEVTASQQRQAIYKWRARKQATKERRVSYLRLEARLHQMRLKFFFKAMQEQFFRQKELVARLSNLANTVDHC